MYYVYNERIVKQNKGAVYYEAIFHDDENGEFYRLYTIRMISELEPISHSDAIDIRNETTRKALGLC